MLASQQVIIIIIPKPGKPDYSLPKAYRLISLLECVGKLLEKIVASRILHNNLAYGLIPSTQFGSHDYSCAVDGVISLTHNIELTLHSRNMGALILFDIQGFFDNLNPSCLLHIFTLLGFPLGLCHWLSSFLSTQSFSFWFNGMSSDPLDHDYGTAQGSPLSPIISAVYTTPLLQKVQMWIHKSLSLFVDNGSIYATNTSIRSVRSEERRVRERVLVAV